MMFLTNVVIPVYSFGEEAIRTVVVFGNGAENDEPLYS